MTNAPGNLPRILGGYELVERVGSGGMGTVYRAIDRRSGTTVAVKIIHPHLQADAGFVARFRDEAHLASLLTSPYIVRVIEFGSDQGEYFLVTEYVEGSRLSDLIAGKGLGVEESLAIAVQVTMALQAAAAHSVVHRDVKPDNIVITPDKAVKLMDFGVARLSYIETRQLFLGTVAYAAPEQFRGQTTVQSDIYSLGIVLFQMLSGELPFKGDTLSSLMRMHDEAPPPLEKLESIPDGLRDILAKCLEKDPSKRYEDPSELLGALRQVRQSLIKPAEPTWISDTMTRLSDTLISDAAATATIRSAPAAAQPRAPLAQDVHVPPPSPPEPPPSPPLVAAGPAPGKKNRLPLLVGGGAILAVAIALFFVLKGDDGLQPGAAALSTPGGTSSPAASATAASPTNASATAAGTPTPGATAASATNASATAASATSKESPIQEKLLKGTFTWDLDSDVDPPASNDLADLWWEQIDAQSQRLSPVNGASIALLKGAQFDSLKSGEVGASKFSDKPIDGKDIDVGATFAVKTNRGSLAKVEVTGFEANAGNLRYNLKMRYVVYGGLARSSGSAAITPSQPEKVEPPTAVPAAPPAAPLVGAPPVVTPTAIEQPPVVLSPTITPIPAPRSGAAFNFAGFSDHTGPGNGVPGDAVASGGTLGACNPSSLYAFVNHNNLQPPKEFVGTWTLNGALLSRFVNTTKPEFNGVTFWQVQGSPTPLSSGAYRFELSVDSNVVSQGSFTLSC